MTFDELCKAVKEANKEAVVETNDYRVTIKIGTKVVAHVYEKYDYVKPIEIIPSSFGEVGYMKLVELALEYDNTEFTERGLTPLWVISIVETRELMHEYQPTELKKVELYLRKVNSAWSSSPTDWVWKDDYSVRNFLTKEQIKEYLVQAYNKEKANSCIDSFIEMFGERVQ